MSVRSFHSVFMASAVAGAALGCYLVSLRVASERAALQQVETSIVLAQRDIRLLQTEIGTRARLAQLERWNVRVLSLSAPTADQILGDKFQLARLIAPERKPAVEAPVVLATAPSGQAPLETDAQPGAASAAAGELLHQASARLPVRQTPVAKLAAQTAPKTVKPAAEPASPKTVERSRLASAKKAGEKQAKAPSTKVTRPVRTANVDPLAPLPANSPTAEASRTNR